MKKVKDFVPCRYCRSAGKIDGVKAYECANPYDECRHKGVYKCYKIPVKAKEIADETNQ